MDAFRYANGIIFFDPADIQKMYSAFAVRITDAGDIEVLVDQEGIGWLSLDDAEQVSLSH
jgi:hypothetical protein